MRDNFGLFIVGEEENIAQFDTSLADFDALIMTQYQLVAAIAGVPATKLLGTSPKGFNATGEHEIRTYEEELESIQTNDMSPLVERHHALAARSELGGLRISHAWNKRRPSPAETAELNSKKAATAQVLLSAGAINNDEERARLKADPDSGYADLLQDGEIAGDDLEGLVPEDSEFDADMPPDGGPPALAAEEGENVQTTSLNGAQVTSMVGIVSQVALGQLPRDSGINLLLAAFPVTPKTAEAIMGAAGRGFVPAGKDGVPASTGSMDGDFEENKHPRAKDGKFGAGGGGSGSKPEPGKGKQDITQLLGKEHTGVKGQAAVNKVLEAQGGHVKGAFERRDIGKIDLAWGDDSFGLKHIMQRRTDQGIDPHQFVSNLAQVIERGKLKKQEDGKYRISHKGKVAIVTQELRGNKMTLLLTGFVAN